MTVNISKPSINIREKLAELDKPSGIAGEAVLRADSVQEIRNQIGAGRKNLIINGGMDVWQRGTSVTGMATTAYQSVDRFKGRKTLAITADIAKGTSTLPDNSKVNTFKVTCTNAETGFIGLSQVLEDAVFDYIDNRVVTLSCWIKTNRDDVTFRHASTADFSVGPYTANGSWQKVSGSYNIPAGTGQHQFDIITFANGSVAHSVGDYLEVTNVQLELGSVATDFEHRSYGEELALCQRYYQKGLKRCHFWYYRSSKFVFDQTFPVVMRAAPTMTGHSVSSSAVASFIISSGNDANNNTHGFHATTTSTLGNYFEWIADAEL